MQLKEVKGYSKLRVKCVLSYKGKVFEFETERGNTYKLKKVFAT
jgi:hypothetical protein